MTEIDMGEPTRLMVAGDWHSNGRYAEKAIYRAHKAGCDTILHLGDFGYWPKHDNGPTFYRHVVTVLRRYEGLRLFWVDGNHEDHAVLSMAEGLGNEVIRHLPRGHRWRWWDKDWMAIGGGVSVDKAWRKPGVDWFPEETLTPAQFEHCLREGNVDIVVAHDAPDGVDIPGIHAKEKLGEEPSFFPLEQIKESWEHRGLLGEIVKEKAPDFWFHGHYHRRYNGVHTSGMRVIGLDCDGTPPNNNAVILTEKDLE